MNDLISRQAAIDLLKKWADGYHYIEIETKSAIKEFEELPSAQSEDFNEWCPDCKEYDQNKHCCPRYNRVIREALDAVEAQRKKGKWINKKYRWIDSIALWWSDAYECSVCGDAGIKNWHYCPNCGADMRGERE